MEFQLGFWYGSYAAGYSVDNFFDIILCVCRISLIGVGKQAYVLLRAS